MPAEMKVFAGAPGTGKTFRAAREAVRILRPQTPENEIPAQHKSLVEQGLIVWVTFHPSYSYEDFVEGFRPSETPEGGVTYSIVPGPFLRACATASMPVGPSRFHVGQVIGRYTVDHIEPGGLVLSAPVQRADAVTQAGRQFVDFWTLRLFREHGLDASDLRLGGPSNARRQDVSRMTGLPTTFLTNSSRHAAVYEYLKDDSKPTPVVLVIDEINRADLSRVFGELITLLEFDKRENAAEEREVTLTYSGRALKVPAELSIVGTMNTADKSLSSVDLALRRRFEFILVEPDPLLTPEAYGGLNVRKLFTDLNNRIRALNGPENVIGHADFMSEKLEELRQREGYGQDSLGQLKAVLHSIRMKTLPFLIDLFRADWNKIKFVIGEKFFEDYDLGGIEDGAQELDLELLAPLRPADWWNPRSNAWDETKTRSALAPHQAST